MQDDFLNLVADYYLKKITKEEVLSGLKVRVDSLNESYMHNFKNELEKKNTGYDLKFKKIVKVILVSDSVNNDSIFNSKTDPAFHLLGDNFEEYDSHKVSNSRWFTDHTFKRELNGEMKSITYNLQFETQDRMNIDGWEKIVLRRMTSLLLSSIFIFLLVFGLLY